MIIALAYIGCIVLLINAIIIVRIIYNFIIIRRKEKVLAGLSKLRKNRYKKQSPLPKARKRDKISQY